MENKWLKQGNQHRMVPASVLVEESLPIAVYTIDYNSRTGEFSLNYLMDKFTFEFDLLNVEDKFINHVLKSYDNTTGNFGILLSGLKGSGKSVTAKVLCNKFDKPVILVDTNYPGLDTFIASLNFECVLFFDEFEKNFDIKLDFNILTIMDGVYNCVKRKIFILTSNSLDVNKCLLSRPSRIRYIKDYDSISKELLKTLLDTQLKDQTHRDSIYSYLISLEVCSIDIVKSLIQEVNIHGFEEFGFIKEIFNTFTKNIIYKVIKVECEYFDYDSRMSISRTIEEATALGREAVLRLDSSKDNRLDVLRDLNNKHIYSADVVFPCRFEDLEVGMYIGGAKVLEINFKDKIIITIDEDNEYGVYFMLPTINYNDYVGRMIL